MKLRSQKKSGWLLSVSAPTSGLFLMHRRGDTGVGISSQPLKFLKISKPVVVDRVDGAEDTIDTASYAETQTHETT